MLFMVLLNIISASVLPMTMFIGSFITPPIMDHFGRRIAHFVISATCASGWFITSLAFNVEVILLFLLKVNHISSLK